MTITPLEF